MIALVIGAMYFLMIRPQQRRRREAQDMQSGLSVGAEVVTIGGLYATIVDVDTETVTLEASPGIRLRYARGAVSRVLPPVEPIEDAAGGESHPDTGRDES